MRKISTSFVNDLKEGFLKRLLERIQADETLMISIREQYINVYYRGGNLLKLTEVAPGNYKTEFNPEYDLSVDHVQYNALNLPANIITADETTNWTQSIPQLKQMMDLWMSKYRRLEREFQQLVERENNRSTISWPSEYFIVDVEYADPDLGAKIDLTGFKWLASSRRNTEACIPCFIEMKYGDDQLDGDAGIVKHISDINALLSDRTRYQNVLSEMSGQFNQLNTLGLYESPSGIPHELRLGIDKKPEYIFLLSNHNPRSSKLKSILNSEEFRSKVNLGLYDLRFAVSSYSGYGLHEDNMLNLEEFLRKLN